ncbi:phosphotransferase enzyme family protein [Kitasatospora sp. NPDC051853]|uniref:phosphotransferase enzyme family protein n=1 Tax=Kitasatospora sp. NPDC051853 TaxID=3364058 RepID=UPI0037B5A9AF
MMPLTEIDRMKRTVAEDWTSAVADRVAAAWGYPPGSARWWRSSACHVFVLPGDGARRYLRFVSDAYGRAERLAGVAGLMARLHGAGAAVVRPVPAVSGELTVTVPTGLGPVCAMVVESAPGEALGVEELTGELAGEWGAALARLHREAAGTGPGLPEAFGELSDVAGMFGEDAELVAAVAELAGWMDRLPRDAGNWGVVHGDFELDNLAWSGGRPTAYDFDEAALSWYAADIAFALRDLAGAEGRADYREFLEGYRTVRPLTDEDVARLPLFAGLNAAVSLVRITRALGRPGPDEAEWLERLRADLTGLAAGHRALVLAAVREWGRPG